MIVSIWLNLHHRYRGTEQETREREEMEAIVGVGHGLGLKGAENGGGRRRRGLWRSESRSRKKMAIVTELRWIGNSESRTRRSIFISTKPSDVKPEEILRLSAACSHSFNRFPAEPPLSGDGDIRKLRIALSHSSFFVSVFAKSQSDSEFLWLRRALSPIPMPFDSQLVGFGRAVSDMGLTASIHDVMVLPSSRKLGIGRLIVQRLVRMLTSRDIYDIQALCSEDERLFFKECGFGDDILASTTMMYTKTLSTCHEVDQNDQIVTRAGRKLLIAPPLRNFTSSKTTES